MRMQAQRDSRSNRLFNTDARRRASASPRPSLPVAG